MGAGLHEELIPSLESVGVPEIAAAAKAKAPGAKVTKRPRLPAERLIPCWNSSGSRLRSYPLWRCEWFVLERRGVAEYGRGGRMIRFHFRPLPMDSPAVDGKDRVRKSPERGQRYSVRESFESGRRAWGFRDFRVPDEIRLHVDSVSEAELYLRRVFAAVPLSVFSEQTMMTPPVPDPTKAFDEQATDVLLAMLVWGEARGEKATGKLAVSNVVLNRVHSGGFGPSVVKVALKPWQFSCFNANDPNRAKLLTPLLHDKAEVWASCYNASIYALRGLAPDPSNGAVFYHSAALPGPPMKGGAFCVECDSLGVYRGTSWGDVVKTATIGNQSFYSLQK